MSYWDEQSRRLHDRRKKAELEGLTGMDAEQADWEEGLEDDEDE